MEHHNVTRQQFVGEMTRGLAALEKALMDEPITHEEATDALRTLSVMSSAFHNNTSFRDWLVLERLQHAQCHLRQSKTALGKSEQETKTRSGRLIFRDRLDVVIEVAQQLVGDDYLAPALLALIAAARAVVHLLDERGWPDLPKSGGGPDSAVSRLFLSRKGDCQ